MKNYKTIGCTVAALTASLFLLNAPSASAQDANRPRGGGQGQRGGGFGAFQDATEEQRSALQQLNQDTREIGMKLSEARNALNDAVFAEKVDEAQIKAKAADLAKVEAEFAVARAKAFAKVRGKFTSEQIEALKRMPAGGRGFGGGGGGGRRGGQGGNQ